jgi:hypothetical protein
VKSTIKQSVLVYQTTLEAHLAVVQSVLSALIAVMINHVKIKNALILVLENVDKMHVVELTIIVQFVIVMKVTLAMHFLDAILSHVRIFSLASILAFIQMKFFVV